MAENIVLPKVVQNAAVCCIDILDDGGGRMVRTDKPSHRWFASTLIRHPQLAYDVNLVIAESNTGHDEHDRNTNL